MCCKMLFKDKGSKINLLLFVLFFQYLFKFMSKMCLSIKNNLLLNTRFCLTFFLVLFFNAFYFSQMLNNKNGNAFTNTPFFNKSFIKNNKIKKLSATISFKKKGSVIKQTNLSYSFSFDKNGRLIHFLESNFRGKKIDSVEYFYTYNSANQLEVERKKEMNGYTSIHYKYNTNGELVLKEFHRDILNDLDSLIHSTVLYVKKIENSIAKNSKKQIVFNNYNLPYKEITSLFSEDGYLLEQKEKMKMSSAFFKKTFSYNDQGWVSSKKNFRSTDSIPSERWEYKYDSWGNLIKLDYYRGKNLLEEKEIYYSEKTNLIANMLIINNITQSLKIIRFKGIDFY